MPGDADAAPAFALTPPEEQLLALIRDGRVDAEIAVRLAISNAEVKERIERLVAKLGVRDRAALRNGPTIELAATESGPVAAPSRWSVGPWVDRRLPVALAMGAVIGIAATWFALRDEGASDADRARSLLLQRLASEPSLQVLMTTPTPSASSTPTARTTTIGGRVMLDAGQLFNRPGHPVAVAESEARESLLIVTLNDASTFVFDNGTIEWHLQDAMFANPLFNPAFGGRLGDVALTLHLLPANSETRFLPGDANSLGIYSAGPSPPAVALWVDGHHAEVGVDGHLYIDAERSPALLVIAEDTGELLDVSRATRLGNISGAWTRCGYETPACDVIARPTAGPERALASGRLVCRPDGVLELETTTFVLELDRLSNSFPAPSTCEGFSTTAIEVAAGDVLRNAAYAYQIQAVTRDGAPLSIVVAGDGTLYVGDIPRKFGCPCRGGN